MAQMNGLNRRHFLRSAGLTAIAGAVGTPASLRTVAASAFEAAPNGKFDFDTPYNRLGTDSTKLDAAVRTNNMEYGINACMGIADMDFRCEAAVNDDVL